MRFWPPQDVWRSYWMFVRRFVAFAIDWAVIAVLGSVLAAPVIGAAFDTRPEHFFIVLLMVIAYFALVNSSLTGGRSLGKRLTGLRVVNARGEPISLARSLVRAAILWSPIAMFAIDFRFLSDYGIEIPGAPLIYALLLVGLGGAQFYLLILAMVKAGRMLHDWAADSFVVRRAEEPVASPMWPGHAVVVAAFFAFSFVLPLLPLSWLEQWQLARTLALGFKLHRALAADRSIVLRGYESDSQGTYSATQGWVSSSLLHLGVHAYGTAPDLDAAMKKVMLTLMAVNPDAMTYSYLSIDATHGGVFSFTGPSNAKGCYGTPQEWRDRAGECPHQGFMRPRRED